MVEGPQGTAERHAWTVPDTLRIGTGLVPRTLNPILATQTVEASIDRLFSDVLITADARGTLVPDLAAVVPSTTNGGISADGLTIRYTLREHVSWQDGRPFSSADVKFTFDAIMNPNNDVVSRHGYDVVKRVETPDAHTVVFRLKRRFAPFVATVFGESDSPYGILPAHLLGAEKTINNLPYNSAPIGTGPFKVTRWLRGNQIELVRNDRYFLGKPKLKSIVIKLIADENTEITQLQTHEIDWFFEVTVNAYKSLRGLPPADVRVGFTPINSYEAVMFNSARPPTKDLRVRQAILYALDKNALVRDLTFGAADPATQDLPSFMWAYDRGLRSTPYDPERAKRLLAAAGYGPARRLALELYFEQSAALNKTLSVQVQSLLAPLGIDVHPHAQLSSVIYGSYGSNGTLARGHFDAALLSWVAGIDPDDSSQFVCANLPPNGYNWARLCDPAMDAAQKVALQTYAQPGRKVAYARIGRILEHTVALDFLWWPKNIQAYNTDLHGFDPNPVVETWNAWKWSI